MTTSTELAPPAPDVLRAMTLNIVHGTRISLPSALFPRTFVLRRLARIAHAARAAHVDVLALQEADGDRRFERTREIARRAGLPVVITPSSHGATLAGRAPLAVLREERFTARRADAKGFVLARARTSRGHEIDVASIHLHALSRHVRSRQIAAFVDAIREERARRGARPLVVLGDLNDDFDGSARELADHLGLHTRDHETPTYTDLGLRLRLDWVLASPELEIALHHVMPPGLSDHRAIVADVRVRTTEGRSLDR
ncbi:endonuclease/exonuclease/phosphatase family protein [Sandaracinus amylolyticus]|uniref:Putative secreted protein n=1 Tax=Sandaracinus amylolyticus TaxID=927083 RepID=A0A0F6SD93_9BACT|nr:endonuclease/exonuclease/phosphatase family protein [Sandaracinus amylolyticus]AKF03044.1 putative secreted protein [Sandaracinus amylolyticus]